ncbi:MAG TPA: SusC/RagA family TonB-linked outer membrane protein [Gemmatimonadaceae bacterium]|jgi:TonB-linked SusC/RagA family outer membrane protein|nr:SusC/RagA family TonB-linked outer membrane protein [Gemmatimonadaceae bacterium]
MTATRLLGVKRRSAALLLATALPLIIVTPQVVCAQAGTISGTITAEGTQRPLGGAQVSVESVPGKAAVTDGSGRFTIADLSGSTAILAIRLLGYRPITDTVRVGSRDIRIELSERALELNSVVVTGTAGGAQTRELGTSVASINAADVTAQTAIPSVESLLNGRAPGVDVIGTTGQVGAGAQIRVRGVGSFSLSSTPLIYIDGIRTDNGQTGIVARFNDISPDEIESIEVLKGPAAATLYGTEAARGVINIITKRGEAGAPTYTFSTQSGNQWFQDAAGRMRTNYWLDPKNDSVWSINAVKSEAANGTPLFRTGGTNNYAASAGGGSGIFRYYASGEMSGAEGITVSNSRSQKNARTNISATPNDKVSFETSVGYITSRTYTAGEGGSPGAIWGELDEPQRTLAACAVLYNPIPRGCGWSRGSIVSPPEVYNQTQNWQDVRRFTGSASLKYDPFSWMSHRFLVGTDYTLEDVNTLLPYQTDSVVVFFLGSRYDGSRSETTQQTTYNTYDYAGSVHFDVRPNVVAKTTVGAQYYTNSQSALTASGTHFPTPGLSTISATGTKGAPTSSLVQNNTLGAYGQQEFALNNRLFLTGALRIDNNSAFGSQAHLSTYPKVSASWVVSDESWATRILPSFVNELRVRGAYGGSGQQPLVNSALRTLAPVAGANGATTLTNSTIGNPDLKPERVLGSEAGFEAGLFQDRAGIDLTLFKDVSHDAILASPVAPSTAFGASTQYINAGQINKQGLELELKGQLINRRNYGWDMHFNLAATTAKIIRIGGGADTLVNVTGGNSVIGTVGDVFQRVGYAPFDLFTYRVVSATYDPTTKKAINPMCDDGHGGTIPCFVPGSSTVQAPLIYFGHTIPTTTGSWTNTLRYRSFRLYVMVDFQDGSRKTDTNFEQMCQVFGDCLENIYPERYSPSVVATAQNGGQLQDYFIRSANFAKLREISLSYEAAPSMLHRIGAKSLALTLSGRNLATRTQYTGLDPESSVSGVGGMSANLGTDQTEYPQLTSFVIGVRLAY